MRKLLVVLPTLLVLAGGCDATRRDFSVCDRIKYTDCLKGFVCEADAGLCVPVNAGIPDAPIADAATGPETSPVDVSVADSKDAPIAIDGPSIDTNTVDTSIVDAPPVVDVAIPDTRIPDAAGTCSIDNDCVGVPAGAYCVNTKCVACKTSNQCNNDAGLLFCSANTCVSCASVSGPDGGSVCPPNTPVCAASGGCVQCVQNSDCPTANPKSAFCVKNQCVGCTDPDATASATDAGAPDGGSTSTGPCTGTTPVCAKTGPIAGQCVGCQTTSNDGGVTSNCTGTTPICNTTGTPATDTMPANPAYTCVPCTSDSQCAEKGVGPGVCMFHQDGRCASAAETIYVQNTAGCGTGPSAGTATTPFCDSQDAITAVTPNSRVIVMSGSNLYPVTKTSTSSPGQVTIIGQNAATTAAGVFIGIHVTAGDVYVRGLTVASGNNTGLTVDAGATLRMNRCIVKGNARGGLIVQFGANFDIANSIFDGNGRGQIGTTTVFGGVYLGGGAPKTGPNRFWFSTIVNNEDRGIICFDTTQTLFGMLMTGNKNTGDYLSCAMDKTSVWSSGQTAPDGTTTYLNPSFLVLDGTDHLSANHRCRDLIDPSTPHPFDDIDGDVRPKPANGRLDCGADEY